MNLPGELRNRIYTEVLEDCAPDVYSRTVMETYVWRPGRGLPARGQPPWVRRTTQRAGEINAIHTYTGLGATPQSHALLQVSRQVNREFALMYYGRLFSFYSCPLDDPTYLSSQEDLAYRGIVSAFGFLKDRRPQLLALMT